jgi:prolactin regulatory element-binding protein
MDCLWLIGLFGWVTGCFHTRRKYAGCFAARNRTDSAAQPLLSILKSHEFPPTVLKFNPTSRLLISGSADNTVRLIAIPDGLGDTCTFYLHVTCSESDSWSYLILSASWSYALLIILALFIVLFAVACQLVMSGAI